MTQQNCDKFKNKLFMNLKTKLVNDNNQKVDKEF